MKDEIDILRVQFADERASYRRREAFLSSVILHLLFIIFILVGIGLILLVVFRPQGIFGDRREQVFDVR